MRDRPDQDDDSTSDVRARRASSRVIRASEIGEYIYCHRAWWLGRVQGVENANRRQLDVGIERHRAHGQLVRRSDQFRRAALVLFLLALALALLLLGAFALSIR